MQTFSELMHKPKSIGNNHQPRSEIIGAGITKGEEMKLTKEDKKLLITALSNLEQSVYNWSDEYVDTINKKYKSNILDAIDKLETKIINNK